MKLTKKIILKFTIHIFAALILLISNISANTTNTNKTPLVAYELNKEWIFLSTNNDTLFKRNDIIEVFGYGEGIYTAKIKQTNSNTVKWAAIDEKGNNIFVVDFDEMGVFHDGYAIVANYTNNEKKDKIFGFIDKKGKVVLPLEYVDAIPFQEGFAYVMKEGKRGYLSNNLDKNGLLTMSINLLGNKVGYNFSEGLAAISNEEYAFGFINSKGEVVINYRFDEPAEFSEGKAKVTLMGKFGFIDKTGNIIINMAFDEAKPFKNQRTFLAQNTNNIPKWALADDNGTKLTDFVFESCEQFSQNFGLVKFEGDFGFINKDGEFAFPYILTNALPFNELGYAYICNIDKKQFGFIDTNGEIKISLPEFSNGIDLSLNRKIVIK